MDVRCDIGFDIVPHSYVTATEKQRAHTKHDSRLCSSSLSLVSFYGYHYIMYIFYFISSRTTATVPRFRLSFFPSSFSACTYVLLIHIFSLYFLPLLLLLFFSFASCRSLSVGCCSHFCLVAKMWLLENSEMVVWCFVLPSALVLLCSHGRVERIIIRVSRFELPHDEVAAYICSTRARHHRSQRCQHFSPECAAEPLFFSFRSFAFVPRARWTGTTRWL